MRAQTHARTHTHARAYTHAHFLTSVTRIYEHSLKNLLAFGALFIGLVFLMAGVG